MLDRMELRELGVLQMIKRSALIALWTFSSMISGPGALGFSVEEAKHQVKETEAFQSIDSGAYADALLTLAVEYYKEGRLGEAEETFRKSIEPAKAAEVQLQCIGLYPTHLMMYAQLLSEGRNSTTLLEEDFKRVDAALIEALKVIDSRPDPGNQKGEQLGAIGIFDKTGNFALRDRYKNTLLKFCRSVERNSFSSKEDLGMAITILNGLSEIELPAGPINELPTQELKLEAESKTSKLTEHRFKRAEILKLRALQLGDRFPQNDESRIHLHRQIAYWYKLFGQTIKADEQEKILSELLGTHNPMIMFPARRPCREFCGMG